MAEFEEQFGAYQIELAKFIFYCYQRRWYHFFELSPIIFDLLVCESSKNNKTLKKFFSSFSLRKEFNFICCLTRLLTIVGTPPEIMGGGGGPFHVY